MSEPGNIQEIPASLGEALIATEEDRSKKLKEASEDIRKEMEEAAASIRKLIIAQPPQDLLGYLWSQFSVGSLMHMMQKEEARPDRELVKHFQFILEYLHAVWSGHEGEFTKGKLDEEKAQRLMIECDALGTKAMFYAMASSQSGGDNSPFGEATTAVEFQAKSSWVLIRGHRYQILEEEFLRFVLQPHDAQLKAAYGVDAAFIAHEIQAIANSFRQGYGDAINQIERRMNESYAKTETQKIDLETAISEIRANDPAFDTDMVGAWQDMFRGGICNLSRHTKLPESLLEDIAYAPGHEKAFFAEGEFCGTPYRQLPARIRPLVKLDDGYYATDGQFVRDSAYRSLQWGLLGRVPNYRDGWNKNQKALAETAFPAILKSQLRDASFFEEVYFKDANGRWAETDLVGILDDTLFVVESKAGVMAMHSPATNFDRHVRTIRELILKAYAQCDRFIHYLASQERVPIYRLKNGNYEEVAKLRLKDYRVVLPIGLTVESFTPFSSMCKQIPEVKPILGSHPFISLSIDDLFVLGRILQTSGELFHYLEVRQAVAAIPNAVLFDEIDHVGAYVTRNRFDQTIAEQLKEASLVTWDSFSDVIDRHFEREDWETAPPPRQTYPENFTEILAVLNEKRPSGWLRTDSFLRNYGSDGQQNVSKVLADLQRTLKKFPVRRVLIGEDQAIQVWLCKDDWPTEDAIQRRGQIACLARNLPSVPIIILRYSNNLKLSDVRCAKISKPSIISLDYAALLAEAEKERARQVTINHDLKDQNRGHSRK